MCAHTYIIYEISPLCILNSAEKIKKKVYKAVPWLQ